MLQESKLAMMNDRLIKEICDGHSHSLGSLMLLAQEEEF
jgi:hypothetical protein